MASRFPLAVATGSIACSTLLAAAAPAPPSSRQAGRYDRRPSIHASASAPARRNSQKPSHSAGSFIPQSEIFPLWKVHRGLVGYGLSVFQGTRIQKFRVTVIDVLKKAYMDQDLIYVRMDGGPISERGANIIAGMSGSPVYFDGKLAGAVSMGNQWPKEPVAMVTPIEYMTDSMNPRLPTRPQFSSVPWSSQPLKFASTGFQHSAVPVDAHTEQTWIDRFARSESFLGYAPAPASPDAPAMDEAAGEFHPLLTPIYASGFSPALVARLNRIVSPFGLRVATGLSSAGSHPEALKADLVPGAMMGVFFATGDVQLGGYGTVTYRKGNHILAFGHPLEQLGPIDFPLSTGYVNDVFSSYQRSEKLCEPGRMVGSLEQDRPWSVMGVIGHPAHTIPLTIHVDDEQTGKSRTFHIQVVDHPLWTGLIADAAAQQVVGDVRSYPGDSMAEVRTEVDAEGLPPIVRSNVYFDYFNPQGMGLPSLEDMDRILDLLESNPFHAVVLKGISVSMHIHPGRKMAVIERVAVDRTVVAPGDRIRADVTLRPWKGKPYTVPMEVAVPYDAPNGPATLMINGGMLSPLPSVPSAGGGITIILGGGSRGGAEPAPNLQEMVRRFLTSDRNDVLVGRVVVPTQSYNINGQRLYNLPPALSSVLHSPRATGSLPLADEAKTVRAMDEIIMGAQGIAIRVQRDEESPGLSTGATVKMTEAPWSPPTAAAPGAPRPLPAAAVDALTTVPDPEEPDGPAAGESGGDMPISTSSTAPHLAAPIVSSPQGTAANSSNGDGVAKKLQTWSLNTAADFAAGRGDGVAIGSLGDLAASPRFKPLQRLDSADVVWAIRTAASGDALIGTGGSGVVYRQDSHGSLSTALKTPELAALSLVTSPDGAAYAGTAPNGNIYRIPARGVTTAAEPFFKTGHHYVLAMALDAQGNLYAGVDGGVIFKIAPTGNGSVWARTNQAHITSLAVAPNGDILAGTSPSGLVLRIPPDGRPSVLWDTADASVSSLAALPNGDVLAGTAPRGEILRLRLDQGSAAALTTTNAAVHDMAVVGDTVYVASGPALYQVLPTDEVRKIVNEDGHDILTVASGSHGELLAGAGNTAVVYRLAAPEGTRIYRTPVKDAATMARWGHVRWEGDQPEGSAVRIESRTGNSRVPDDTWSPWTAALVSPDGAATQSPRGRYIQLQALLTPGPTGRYPVVRSLALTYLPENRPPIVAVSSPSAGATVHGKVDLRWQGQDPDGDALLYNVEYSDDGGATWKKPDLTTAGGQPAGSDLTESAYEWDTSGLKDGTYLLRAAVSDRRSNPGNALGSSVLAGPFQVTNSRLRLSVPASALQLQSNHSVALSGSADGHGSPVVAVSYRIDGGPWYAASPKAGFFDAESVAFRVETDPLPAGDHKLQIEATNAAGETTTTTITVQGATTAPASGSAPQLSLAPSSPTKSEP